MVAIRFGMTDGQPKTLDEIGKVYGVTRERIPDRVQDLSKLRHRRVRQVLRDYLDKKVHSSGSNVLADARFMVCCRRTRTAAEAGLPC